METLGRAWDLARSALEQAERLVLVGYSLPDADVLARQLLRRAFATNLGLRVIDCVNPDVSLALKLKATLGPEVVRMYQDINSYLLHG